MRRSTLLLLLVLFAASVAHAQRPAIELNVDARDVGRVKDNGDLQDVIPGTPAYEAGISPGMKLIAVVNGRRFTTDVFRDTLLATSTRPATMTLLISQVGAP